VSPGSTGGPIRRTLEYASRKYVVFPGLALFYAPEFVQLGNVLEGMRKSFASLVGCPAGSPLHILRELLISEAPVVHMTWEEAELAKIGLNCALSLKPILANTLAPICNHYGANIDTVTDFIGLDPRVGPKLLRAGLHPGGPCLPRDIRALEAAGKGVGATSANHLAHSINIVGLWEMREWVQFLKTLSMRHFDSKTIMGVAVLGLNYKPGVLVAEEAFGDKLTRRLFADEDGAMGLNKVRGVDSAEDSIISIEEVIYQKSIIVLTLMDPILKEILERVDLKDRVIVDPWRYLDQNKLRCLAYYGGLE
jgi:UDPglucose 6-dehydrogenase